MKKNRLLYEKEFEHDSCGVGFVADIDGTRTNKVLKKAIQAVINLTHRGATGSDKKTGDGAGLLTQLPLELFDEFLSSSVNDIPLGHLGVGMFFMPKKTEINHKESLEIIKNSISKKGLLLLAIREVPINPSVLGQKALDVLPDLSLIHI